MWRWDRAKSSIFLSFILFSFFPSRNSSFGHFLDFNFSHNSISLISQFQSSLFVVLNRHVYEVWTFLLFSTVCFTDLGKLNLKTMVWFLAWVNICHCPSCLKKWSLLQEWSKATQKNRLANNDLNPWNSRYLK